MISVRYKMLFVSITEPYVDSWCLGFYLFFLAVWHIFFFSSVLDNHASVKHVVSI